MTTETLFLQPKGPQTDPFENVAVGSGAITFRNSNKRSANVLTASEANTLVNGGTSAAISEAAATYLFDPGFSAIFNRSSVFGLSGTYQGEASSRAEILASYNIKRGETLSFDFDAGLSLEASEIDNPNQYSSFVEQEAGFLVLELNGSSSSNRRRSGDDDDDDRDDDSSGDDDDGSNRQGSSRGPRIIGYFGFQGQIESAEESLDDSLSKSDNIRLSNNQINSDIGGNNGVDFLNGQISGHFSQNFGRDSQIVVVKITSSFVRLAGDDLIDTLGQGVTYGSLEDDKLNASRGGSEIYASLGNDEIIGNDGKDTFEGGQGNDRLRGKGNDDRLNGGSGNDYVDGGSGDDLVVGGAGRDVVTGGRGDDILVGVDLSGRNVGGNEIDELTGDRGKDRFVLGDQNRVFYRGGGDRDYALISDFGRSSGDRILLHGQATDYNVDYHRRSRQAIPSGSRIYYTGGSSRELIGVVEDVNLEGRLSDSSIFAYNQNVIA